MATAMALASTPAWACGVSAGGVPGVCSVAAHEAAAKGSRPLFRVSAAATRTVTSVDFSNGSHVGMERSAMTGGFDWRPSEKWTLSFTAGALLTGSISSPRTGVHEMSPGPLFAFTASWRVVEQKRYGLPFVLFSITGAGLFSQTKGPSAATAPGGPPAPTSLSPTVQTPYTAFDVRFAAVVGSTLGTGKVSATPYAVARLFGGPIFWNEAGESVTGTDTYKHQLGVGVATRLGPVDLFVEGVPVGERALTGGAGVSF
jgi:hypothetical protein